MDVLSDMAEEFAQGFMSRETEDHNTVKRLDLRSRKAAAKFGKRRGLYLTYDATLENFDLLSAMQKGLEELALQRDERILLIGIGNPRYEADSLGGKVLDRVDIRKYSNIYKFKPLCSAETGIESFDLIKGVVKTLKPSIVVMIDALVTSNPTRLGNSYQFTSAGLIPGGGLASNRKLVDESELGVPIIAIGVPFVIYTSSLVRYCGGEWMGDTQDVVFTPSQVDMMVEKSSGILAQCISSLGR